MPPPVPVPLPPAIHAPVPVQQAQNAASMQSLPVRSMRQMVSAGDFVGINNHPRIFPVFRWQHIKHWKGKSHRSQAKRANGRKASKKAKNRRKRG